MAPTDIEVDEDPGSEIQQNKGHVEKLTDGRIALGEPQHDGVNMAHAARLNATSDINQAASPLLRLPAELRNKIYSYALSDRVLIHPAVQQPMEMCYEPDSSMHNLPLVCRQLYQETHLLVYQLGTFDLTRPDWFPELISGRKEVKKAITEIRIDISELYLVALSSFEELFDELAKNYNASDYQRCCAELHSLKGLQRIVLNPVSVSNRLSVTDWLDLEMSRPELVTWAMGRITNRGDVEIIYT